MQIYIYNYGVIQKLKNPRTWLCCKKQHINELLQNIHTLGLANTQLCSFSKMEEETISHLFYYCIHIQDIWDQVQIHFAEHGFLSFNNFLNKISKIMHVLYIYIYKYIYYVCICVCIYEFIFECKYLGIVFRNERVFWFDIYLMYI